MYRRFTLVLLLYSLTLLSCHTLFCVWDMGYNKIGNGLATKSLIGLYSLDKHSKDQMSFEGDYKISEHTLELKNDGTYEFINLPDWALEDSGTSTGKLVHKTGKWTFSCDDKYGCDINLEGVMSSEVMSKNNKLAVLLNIGDPDDCIGLVYVKNKN